MAHKTPAFQYLPIDVHLAIIRSLPPLDIVSLGHTCTALREASTHRSVWMPFLDQVFTENGIFRPSYNVAQLSGVEIQHIALQPHSMISRYQKHITSSSRTWTPITKTRHVLPGILDMGGNFVRFLYIVPGGRFLVTYSGYHKHLCIWDLACIVEHNSEHEPIMKWEYHLKPAILCSQSLTGAAIRISALAKPVQGNASISSERFCYTVFEYQPALEKHNAHSIVYNTPHRPEAQSLNLSSYRFVSGNFFGEIWDGAIYIWDCSRDLWVSWKVDMENIQTVFLTGGRIVLVGFTQLACWDIPEAPLWCQFTNLPVPQDISPIFAKRIPHHFRPLRPREHIIQGAGNSWTNQLAIAPCQFDIIERFPQQSLISILVHGFFFSMDRPDLKTVYSFIKDLSPSGDREIVWDDWRVLHGHVFRCLSNFNAIQLYASRSTEPTKATQENEHSLNRKAIRLLLRDEEDQLVSGEFSFDAFSGKLCYASLSEEGSVAIVDYLIPQ